MFPNHIFNTKWSVDPWQWELFAGNYINIMIKKIHEDLSTFQKIKLFQDFEKNFRIKHEPQCNINTKMKSNKM